VCLSSLNVSPVDFITALQALKSVERKSDSETLVAEFDNFQRNFSDLMRAMKQLHLDIIYAPHPTTVK